MSTETPPELFREDEVASSDKESSAQTATVRARSVSVSYQAPLPPAQEMKYYNEILPGSADRIIAMAEKAQSNQHHYNNRLLFFAFIIILSVLGIAAYLIQKGQSLAGLSLVLTELGLIIATMYRSKSTKKTSE